MTKVIVMDYSTCEVHVFTLPNGMDAEEFVLEQCSQDGQTFTGSNCEWMTVDLSNNEMRLPIYIH